MNHLDKRINALWLCSWYPDKMQPQNGDFIQRHAQATSLFSNVNVIHVAPTSPSFMQGQKVLIETTNAENLTENILYYEKKKNTFLHRGKSVLQSFFQYRKWVKKHFQTNGKPDIVHLNVGWRDGIVALWIKRTYNIPFVLTEHWTFYHEEGGRRYRNTSFLFRYLTKKILKEASYILPVSNHLGKVLNDIYPNPHMKTVNNVVDTHIFHFEERKTNSKFRFLHVSSNHPLKNVGLIVKAFNEIHKAFPETELYIVGGEKLEMEQQYGISDGIILTSTLPYNEVAQYMQSSDCFLLFSSSENQPCVLLESLCCGLPIISSNVGGIGEIIDSNNGALIVAGDVKQLVSQMSYMINHNIQYPKYQISKNAASEYSYEKIGSDINDIYQTVLSDYLPKES
ncbi:MAG: hypothetical protein DI598_01270 [Pseudopedobacter saltans]|uniref:Glycosyl transferase group 1 n=1 Tax=Pseudopedobacter saltans TaxID=151895 RepID=A0A2W5H2G2_9SPHI|nr:MAG: hypothetical protein DI598_01270 [Pseudopedobacter saltans]